MLENEMIGNWSKARLDQYIRRVAAASSPSALDSLKVVDELALGDLALTALRTQMRPTYGTTLPAHPKDGDEHILVDSLTAPTYQWRLRYNDKSTSAYKWEFIGGPFKGVYVGTSEAHAGTGAWANLATNGPSFTLPYAGDWEFHAHTGGTGATGSAATNQFGIANGDTTPIYAVGTVNPAASYQFNMAFTAQFVSLAASSVMKLRYWSNGNSSFFNRGLHVRPVRIS